jgi:hypothetical protein
MTLLGKLLVCLHFVLSLVFLTWAAGVYTQHINWTKGKSADSQEPGELARREKRTDEAKAATYAAQERWKATRADLVAIEKRRRDDQPWLDDRRKELKTGIGGNKEAAVLGPEIRDGRTVDDPNAGNRPKLIPIKDRFGKDLHCLAYYEEKQDAVLKDIEKQQKDYKTLVDRDKELTDQILSPKGFRQRVDDEKAKRANLEKERDYLEGAEIDVKEGDQVVKKRRGGVVINVIAETDLLLRRREHLERRIEQLENALQGTRKP